MHQMQTLSMLKKNYVILKKLHQFSMFISIF